jgi:hypothetical protein
VTADGTGGMEGFDDGAAEKANGGRSFVIGCFIALFVMIAIALLVLIFGRQAAIERAKRTQVLLLDLAKQLRARQKVGRLPVAIGAGSDYSGQEAMSRVIELRPAVGLTRVRGLIVDAWGQPLRYRSTDGRSFLLYSCGPNSRDDFGGFDDIAQHK